jgi:hypothetical protein
MPSSSTTVDRDVPIAIKSNNNARWPQRAVAFLLLGLAAVRAENTAIAASSDYEAPGLVETATLVPESLLDVRQARVDPRAEADGWHVTYTLDGPEGVETLTGTEFLANRLREIRAIAALRKMNKSEEFGKALLASGGEKLQSVASAVKDPVQTIQKLPKGASKFFGRLGTTVKNAAEGKIGATDAAEAALGVQRKRAELCLKLGVSPFTRDPVLRAELDTASRAMAAGATLMNVTGLIVGGGIGTAISVVNANQAFQRALVESSPQELAARNRQLLAKLGASPESVDGFLGNPAFNPWQKSGVAATLSTIGLNPEPFLSRAADASSDEDAVYFIQMVRILGQHQENKTPLAALLEMDGIPCALDQNGMLVVPVGSDLIRWTPALNARAGDFVEWSSDHAKIKGMVLATDGSVSERATGELARMGITVAPHALGSPH